MRTQSKSEPITSSYTIDRFMIRKEFSTFRHKKVGYTTRVRAPEIARQSIKDLDNKREWVN